MLSEDSALYQRAIRFLNRRTNYETFKSIPYSQMEKSLARLREFLDFLGAPDRRYAIVCVAGTKGKGSVCSALDKIYRAAGFRVGLFTSPHIDEVVERFQIDGKNCDKTLFAEVLFNLAERWKEFVAKRKKSRRESYEGALGGSLGENEIGQETKMTFFEWSLVLAVVLFARAQVDVAILEVGMGGRFDATNVCDADVSVLTSVSYDHCEQLGRTIAAIASEKLGIVKTNAPLVCGVGFSNVLYPGLLEARKELEAQALETAKSIELGEGKKKLSTVCRRENFTYAIEPETLVTPDDVETARNLARERAAKFNAPFYAIESISPIVADLPTPPFDSVKRWNFEIALKVVDVLATRTTAPKGRPGSDGARPVRQFPVSRDAILRAASSFETPCRFEVVSTKPLVVVDGAHNRASIAAFMRALSERYPKRKSKIMFAISVGKDARGMLAEIAPFADEVILTERSCEIRSESLPELIQATEDALDEVCAEDAPLRKIFRVVPDYRAFLADYCSRPNQTSEILCAVGSFYFAAEVRRIVRRE